MTSLINKILLNYHILRRPLILASAALNERRDFKGGGGGGGGGMVPNI